MKIVLNQNTCKNLNLSEFLKYSKKFYGVELNYEGIDDAITDNLNINDIIELLGIYGLKIFSIYSLTDFSLCSENDFKEKILPNFKKMLNYLYKFESELLIVNPSLFPESQDAKKIPRWRIINRTQKRIVEISKIAFKSDIKIGFEFTSFPNSSISTLKEAEEVIGDLEDVENLGYVIDTFHLIKSKVDLNQLNDIKEQIFLFQLNDLKFKNQNDLIPLNDSDRILPGEGNFEFKNLFKISHKMGYKKPYSLELHKDDCIDKLYKKIYPSLTNFVQISQ